MVPKPIAKLQNRIAELEEENILLTSANENQIAEIHRLEKDLERLKQAEAKYNKERQKTKELEKQLQQTEEELTEVKQEEKTQKVELTAYREKLAKVSNEIGYTSKRLRSCESENVQLKSQIKQLTTNLTKSEQEANQLSNEVTKLRVAIEDLKEQKEIEKEQAQNFNPAFREHVKVRRELNSLREQVARLQNQLNKASKTTPPRIGYLQSEF